jgi:hypothetical protein
MSFITQVDTETLSNQNISAALLVGTFTNTTRIRKLFINVFLDQIAGNGAYVCYVTIQRAGSGSAYETIRAIKDAASGVTAITFNSIPVTLNSTDVMKVYVIGLAGDTTTPDIIYDLNEEFPSDGINKNAVFSNFEFLMVDSADHVTPKTGLTVAGQRSIDGAAFASVGGTIAEVASGIYQFDALAADTNGDLITWKFTATGADPVYFTFSTV